MFKICLDFKFVTYNNYEIGAAGPYIAFAPFAWAVLSSGRLVTPKIYKRSTLLFGSSVAPVLCLPLLFSYFKAQFLKYNSSLSDERQPVTSQWKAQSNLSRNTKFLRNFNFKSLGKI